MGLFLGLTGGMVLSVIITFRGARAIDASPGVEPFSDPQFAEYHNDAVAGYIGQDLFMVGGTVALVLLGVAVATLITNWALRKLNKQMATGARLASVARSLLLVFCLLCMIIAASITVDMNNEWPALYDQHASDKQLVHRRDTFDYAHKRSEKFASYAWLSGFLALTLSPWCRRIADAPVKEPKESQ